MKLGFPGRATFAPEPDSSPRRRTEGTPFLHTVRSHRRRSSGGQRLAKAGVRVFAVLGGAAAIALPANAAHQPAQANALPSTPTVTVAPETAPAMVTVAYSNAAATRAKVVNEAMRHRGAPYHFGAAGPNSFDCSGFTMYVFRKFGVSLPHKAAGQRWKGRAVSRSQARAGDLVVFYSGGRWSHVGIYLGNGYMIDAPHSGARVRVEKIWSNSVVFRRLIG